MRIGSVQNTQRVYDDIRVCKLTTDDTEQELLIPDLVDEGEEVHLFEMITSQSCQIVFTFSNGKISRPKMIEPNRVVTFENLRPIVSVKFIGTVGTSLDVAVAV